MTRRSLIADRRGATLVEFGLVAPVMIMFLLGLLDIGHTLYVQAALQGAVQKAGRDSSLETGADEARQTALDDRIRSQVRELVNNATVTTRRRNYQNFTDAAAKTPEQYTDGNHDGLCDNGESYFDINDNSVWDADGAEAGQGGAKDATIYTVTVSYPRLLPMTRMLGWQPTVTMNATTVLRNQPYADQAVLAAPVTRNCL